MSYIAVACKDKCAQPIEKNENKCLGGQVTSKFFHIFLGFWFFFFNSEQSCCKIKANQK